MEHLIDGLLRAFETGGLTRRELIKSLAAAAVAASPTLSASSEASTIPPPAGPAPWKTLRLDHISYSVSDYRRSAAFYRDLMGWEISKDNQRSQCSLKIGDAGVIIIRNSHGTAGRGRQATPRVTGAIDHMAWGIHPWDTNTVRAELERRGLKPRPDMIGEAFKSFHVKDPDGFDLQISNQREMSSL